MKLLLQLKTPIKDPIQGRQYDFVAISESLVDDDNVIVNHPYGVLIIRRADIDYPNILPDDFDMNNFGGNDFVWKLN